MMPIKMNVFWEIFISRVERCRRRRLLLLLLQLPSRDLVDWIAQLERSSYHVSGRFKIWAERQLNEKDSFGLAKDYRTVCPLSRFVYAMLSLAVFKPVQSPKYHTVLCYKVVCRVVHELSQLKRGRGRD